MALPLEHHYCHGGMPTRRLRPGATASASLPSLHAARQLLQHRVAFVARHALVAFFGMAVEVGGRQERIRGKSALEASALSRAGGLEGWRAKGLEGWRAKGLEG